ncbi:MAG: glutathione S-transferase N-terminal domain-containing protein [Caulobacteraceae bacterium]
MLELYHADPNANSAKPLFALYEKGVPFTSRWMDFGKWEQHSDWFKALNPNGQVPALVHDGKVITESTVICEYIDEVFDGPPLRPGDPYWRARMRIWTKFVDEYFCPAVSLIGWHIGVARLAKALSDAEFEAHVRTIPLPEQQAKWRLAREGFPQDQLDDARRRVETSIKRMEAALAEHPWLAGDAFSLAEIGAFPMAQAVPYLMPEFVGEASTPRVIDWLQRVYDRPAIQAALKTSRNPNPRAVPGREALAHDRNRDGREGGRRAPARRVTAASPGTSCEHPELGLRFVPSRARRVSRLQAAES